MLTPFSWKTGLENWSWMREIFRKEFHCQDSTLIRISMVHQSCLFQCLVSIQLLVTNSPMNIVSWKGTLLLCKYSYAGEHWRCHKWKHAVRWDHLPPIQMEVVHAGNTFSIELQQWHGMYTVKTDWLFEWKSGYLAWLHTRWRGHWLLRNLLW